MNFAAVRTIRRGRRNGESGQAFAELAISLIAIMAAFAGFLLVSVLSADGVSISIEARKRADELSSNGYYSNAVGAISRWDHAQDASPFAQDGQDSQGGDGNGAMFKYQLRDPSGKVSFIGSSELRYDNEFDGLQDTDFFVSAADLSDGSASTSDSLKDHGIGALESAVRGLFRVDRVEIRDTVYMPAHKDIPELR